MLYSATRRMRILFCALVVFGAALASSASAAVKTATWVGAGGGGDDASYNDPNNWDIDALGNPGLEVPVNTLTDTYIVILPTGNTVNFNVVDPLDVTKTFDVFQLTLAQGSTLVVDPARKLNVVDAAAVSGTISTAGGLFTAPSGASSFGVRTTDISVSGEGTVVHGATGTYSTPTAATTLVTAIAVDGANSLLDLPSLQTIDAGWDDRSGSARYQQIVATNGGTMDLSGVTQIIAPWRYEDRLNIIINSDGAGTPLIDLSGLETLSSVSAGDTFFDIEADTSLTLGNLQTASNAQFDLDTNATLTMAGATGHDLGGYTLASGAAVNAASLTSLTRVTLNIADGARFNAPALVDITGSTVTLSSELQQFTHDTLSAVDAKLMISGGAAFSGASDTEYNSQALGVHTTSSNAKILSVDGAGSQLLLPSIQTINAGWDDQSNSARYQQVVASNGGVMDLSGVTGIIAPLRAEDRLHIIINHDGAGVPLIDLGALQTLSSARDGDTWFDMAADTSLTLGNLQTASNAQFDLDTNATLTMAGATGHDLGGYTLASGAAVNAASLTSLTRVTLNIADGARFNAPALVDITGSTVTLSSELQQFTHDTLSAVDAKLMISGGAAFSGASDTEYNSQALGVHTTSSNAKILSVDGAGSQLLLPSIQIINAGWDDHSSSARYQQIVASNSGAMDLSGVTGIIAPLRDEDRLHIIVNHDGAGASLIDVSSLQTLSSVRDGDTWFDLAQDTNLSLAGLRTASNAQFTLAMDATLTMDNLTNHDQGAYTLATGSTVSAPALTSLTNIALSIADGAHFNVPAVVDVTGSTVNLSSPTQQFTHGGLNAADIRMLISGGAVFGGTSDTEYDTRALGVHTTSSNAKILSVDGAGSQLLLPSIQTINAGWDDHSSSARYQQIVASNSGVMDLSGVTGIIAPLRAEDRLHIIINHDGAGVPLINLGALHTLSSLRDGDTWFDIAAGTNLPLPNLQTASDAQFTLAADATVTSTTLASLTRSVVTIANGAHFNAPALVDIGNTTVTLADPSQRFTHGTLSGVDARLLISGGVVFSGVSDTEYDSRGEVISTVPANANVLSADGAATQLLLPAVNVINAGWNDGLTWVQYQQIIASNDGQVDLSGVTEITAPWRGEDHLNIIAETGGQVDLSALQTVGPPAGGGGQVDFIVRNAGQMTLGNVPLTTNTHFLVDDVDSVLDINGGVQLTSGSFTMASGATVNVEGNFVHEYTVETNLQASSAILHMDGAGTIFDPQYLEVAGVDSGAVDPSNNGNFGYGQLVVGTDAQPTVVTLVDLFDNGNRTSPEALYLFGLGGPDGLLLNGGSTLVIGSIPTYAKIDGAWTLLSDLFMEGETEVDFGAITSNPIDNGFISMPDPPMLIWSGVEPGQWTDAQWRPGPTSPLGGEVMVIYSGTVTVSADLSATPADSLGIARGGSGGTVNIAPGGKLVVNGDVDVGVGGTLRLDGTLTASTVNVNGGVLTSADNATSIGTVEGNVTLTDGSTFTAEAIGPGVDGLAGTGTVTLGVGTTLDIPITGGGNEFNSGVYLLIDAAALSGTFTNVSDLGAYVSVNGNGLTYDAGGGTLTLTLDMNLNPGDGNLDGATDVSDRIIWNTNNFTFDTTFRTGDFNNDGATDVSDRIVWNTNNFTFASAAPAGPIAAEAAGPPSGDPKFIYDFTTGVMRVEANGNFLTEIVVNGNEGASLLSAIPFQNTRGGFIIWMAQNFNGKFQAYDAASNGDSGSYDLAEFAIGLDENDFLDGVDWGSVPELGQSGVGGNSPVTIVPEPATLALLAVLGVGLLARRRRRR